MTRHPTILLCLLLWACGCDTDGHGREHAEHEGGGQHSDSAGEGSDRVTIDPAAIERNDIRVEEVRSAVVAGGIEAPAEVQLPPDRMAHVTSLVSGQLERVEATVGDQVEEGQVLATLRSAELGESRGAVEEARAQLEVARSNFQRQQELEEAGIGARRDFLEAQGALRSAEAAFAAARRRVSVYGQGGTGSSTPIRSPIAGTVLQQHATVGEIVHPDEALFVVGDPSLVWVVGRVYPQDVGQVAAGAPVTVSLQSDAERTWEGTLDYVAPSLDQGSRTMPVRVELENADGSLRPGLFATLSITPASTGGEPAPAVEADAVIRMGDREVVFVPGEDVGHFRAVPVTPGSRGGGLVQIREGLSPGERYVADGAFVLKSELSRSQLGHGHAH